MGPPVELSDQMTSMEDLGNGRGLAAFSGYMIRQHADKVRLKQRGCDCALQLHFEHQLPPRIILCLPPAGHV